MFFLHKGNKLNGIVCCHVDNFFHAGEENFENIMNSLRKSRRERPATLVSESSRTKMVLF